MLGYPAYAVVGVVGRQPQKSDRFVTADGGQRHDRLAPHGWSRVVQKRLRQLLERIIAPHPPQARYRPPAYHVIFVVGGADQRCLGFRDVQPAQGDGRHRADRRFFVAGGQRGKFRDGGGIGFANELLQGQNLLLAVNLEKASRCALDQLFGRAGGRLRCNRAGRGGPPIEGRLDP